MSPDDCLSSSSVDDEQRQLLGQLTFCMLQTGWTKQRFWGCASRRASCMTQPGETTPGSGSCGCFSKSKVVGPCGQWTIRSALIAARKRIREPEFDARTLERRLLAVGMATCGPLLSSLARCWRVVWSAAAVDSCLLKPGVSTLKIVDLAVFSHRIFWEQRAWRCLHELKSLLTVGLAWMHATSRLCHRTRGLQ